MLAWVRRQFIIGRFYSPFLWAIVVVGHCFNQLVFWASTVAAAVGAVVGANWWWQPAALVGVILACKCYAVGCGKRLRGSTCPTASKLRAPRVCSISGADRLPRRLCFVR